MYEDFGLDPAKVMAGLIELRSNGRQRERLRESTNIFRVLIKTLLKAGLISDRTKAFYATYVDMDELKLEGDRMVGDDIAEEGIKYLQEINFKDRSNGPTCPRSSTSNTTARNTTWRFLKAGPSWKAP